MNNLYSKVAVASVGIALSFALEGNKEAKAATIILTPVTSFSLTDQNFDGIGDSYYGRGDSYYSTPVHGGQRAFYEFNIANLSLASKVISNVIFQVGVDSITVFHRYYSMELFGYTGNGQPDISDFEAGGLVTPKMTTQPATGKPVPLPSNFNLKFSAFTFVNELISKNDAFAGFSVGGNPYGVSTLNQNASLIITTVDVPEPVPEPTTIFGSAIGLCLGGWLKRKNSNRQNKTTPQH